MPEGDPTNAEKPDLTIGSYRLIEPLGSGGMSSVYRAVHRETGHEVAVKILPRSLAKNPTMLQRFLREAQSAEALEHPNIVSIFDRGVDQGRHYLVLEFIHGGDLHDRVRNEGPLDVDQAIGVIRGVAEGLKYASERGLIHRDIKPANLLLADSGQVKICDLGLALKEAEDERVTRDGTTVGTVDYMAPEQARDSRATSERSDIYSLGCTLYYLLTGSPPYPGGDIADKLSRHCTQPSPDPCAERPEVPRILGLLVRKMMAKRPENRFRDYDEVLSAVKAIPVGGSSPATEAVDAIIEEDDEDTAGIPLAPIESGVSGALVVGKARGGDSGPSHGSPFNLADLADEDEDSPPPPRRRPPSTSHGSDDNPEGGDGGNPEALLDDSEGDDLAGAGDEDEEELVEGLTPSRNMPALEMGTAGRSLKWVYAGIGGSIALILLVIVINLVIKPAKKPEASPPEIAQEQPEAPVAVEPEPAPIPAAPAPPKPPPPSSAVARAAPKVPTAASPTPGASRPGTATPAKAGSARGWTEPGDATVEAVAEPPFPPDVEARFALPAWAKAPVPQRLVGTSYKVRRISDPGNTQERSSLGSAFDAMIGPGTTELIDDGPFLESDLRLHGEVRLVRALEGRRPIIRFEQPKLPVIREQPALFVLDGKQLILDGVDLIVDLQDIPREHSSLFYCKGGSLTLHRCTITIVNPLNRPFTLIQALGAERPAQVRLEDTFVRGATTTMVELDGGGVELVLVRSVVVGGQGPLIVSSGDAPGGERQIHVRRSILASRGPFLELTTPGVGRPAPLSVRALSTTFARFRSDALVSLIAFHDEVGEAKEFVDWNGEQNSFMGWNDWTAMGNGHTIKVASLAVARTTWPGTDAQSRELPTAWPIPPDFNRVLPEQMKTLAPHELATLVRVAAPSPFLWEKTIEEFRRPELPSYFSPIPNVVLTEDGVPAEPQPSPPVEFLNPANPNAPVDPNAPPVIAVKELVFDVAAKPWSGNLGQYLLEQVRDGDARVKVRVSGTGRFPFNPVRLPEGTSLEVVVETTRANGGVPPSWTVARGTKADALIDVRHGNLVLTGVELTRDPSSGLKALIRVDDGHLVVNHCRLLSTPGTNELGGGNLLSFRAAATRPLADRPSPFDRPVDKPTCRIIDSVLIATGDVLTAEIGRGIVALTQCAIAAGGNAFVLLPAAVARGRFEADLWLERCTLAAEKTFVLLGPWPGGPPGPDRPWLVNSRDSAYMSSYNPVSKESVLLRVEPNSLAQGALFWQGSNDAYEVTNFTARADRPTSMNPHPDVHRQWVSIWGPNHFRSITGPSRNTAGTVKLHDRLRPGDVSPGELALDTAGHAKRSRPDIGVDMRRLQVTPGSPRSRPRR